MKYCITIPLICAFLVSGSPTLADNNWSRKAKNYKTTNDYKADRNYKNLYHPRYIRKWSDDDDDDDKSGLKRLLGRKFQQLQSLIETNQTAIVDLNALINQLQTDISGLRTEYVTLRTNHETDIARLEALILNQQQSLSDLQLNLNQDIADLRTELQIPLDNLAQAVDNLSVDLANLQTQLGVDTEIRLQQAESSIQSLNDQLDDVNVSLDALDARVVNLETAVPPAQDQQPDGTLCLSISNTSGIDITNNDWFDQCVETPGTNVRVVLKDQTGTVVYSAEGMKNNEWTQDAITSSSIAEIQFTSSQHNLIALDNGDNLMITSKSAANNGCGGSLGNGYGIIIYGPTPYYLENIKMLVMSYNQFNTFLRSRTFEGWQPQNEISYANGNDINTCPTTTGLTLESAAFIGIFEMYVF